MKKKSTTPRTDKAEKLIARGKIITVKVEFAIKLEKEINTLKKRIERQQATAKVAAENRVLERAIADLSKSLNTHKLEVWKLTCALHQRAREATELINECNEKVRLAQLG